MKATGESDSSPYAASKWDADVRLEQELGDRFAHAGLSLTIMRPLALLFPPFDAGKISRLGFLRWWPSALTPPVKLPVLAPKAFLAAVESSVRAALDHETHAGFSRRDFAKSDRGNLRDVRAAMLACAHMGGSE